MAMLTSEIYLKIALPAKFRADRCLSVLHGGRKRERERERGVRQEWNFGGGIQGTTCAVQVLSEIELKSREEEEIWCRWCGRWKGKLIIMLKVEFLLSFIFWKCWWTCERCYLTNEEGDKGFNGENWKCVILLSEWMKYIVYIWMLK